MELELNRIDYYSVSATLPNCMKLMPATRYKEQQRVSIRNKWVLERQSTLERNEINILCLSGGCWRSRRYCSIVFDEKR